MEAAPRRPRTKQGVRGGQVKIPPSSGSRRLSPSPWIIIKRPPQRCTCHNTFTAGPTGTLLRTVTNSKSSTAGQRSLMTLVQRKLLASSSFAIAGALDAIANRLSLRPPQRESLEILARICEILPLEKDADVAAALQAVKLNSRRSRILARVSLAVLRLGDRRGQNAAHGSLHRLSPSSGRH